MSSSPTVCLGIWSDLPAGVVPPDEHLSLLPHCIQGGGGGKHAGSWEPGAHRIVKVGKKPLIPSKSNYSALREAGKCPMGMALLPMPSPQAVPCHSSELFSHTGRSGWLWAPWKPVSRRHSPVVLCSQLEEQCSLKQTGLDKPSPSLELAAGNRCPQPAHISSIISACQSRRRAQYRAVLQSNGSRVTAV